MIEFCNRSLFTRWRQYMAYQRITLFLCLIIAFLTLLPHQQSYAQNGYHIAVLNHVATGVSETEALVLSETIRSYTSKNNTIKTTTYLNHTLTSVTRNSAIICQVTRLSIIDAELYLSTGFTYRHNMDST